jgi:hypothetical protein
MHTMRIYHESKDAQRADHSSEASPAQQAYASTAEAGGPTMRFIYVQPCNTQAAKPLRALGFIKRPQRGDWMMNLSGYGQDEFELVRSEVDRLVDAKYIRVVVD